MYRVVGVLALAGALLTSGCGLGGEDALGDVQIFNITSPVQACVSTPMVIEGLNFLSEHGIEVTVRFEAVDGTPFEGGTSAMVEVDGMVTSNTTVELMSPISITNTTAIITVTLPGGISGTSQTDISELTGGFLGPPNAVDDNYNVVGNVQITVPAALGVLLNDEPGDCLDEEQDVDKVGSTTAHMQGLSVVNFDAVSDMGGEVSVNPDGSFTYNPPVGFQGGDSFEYEMTNGSQTSFATVDLVVQEMVWFINDQAPGGGDGRFTNPLNSLFAFDAIQGGLAGPGDYIFVYRGSGQPYDGGVRLLEQQTLIGEGVELNLLGQSIVAAGVRPILTNQGLNDGMVQIGVPCVVLANGTTVTGVNIESPTGHGIEGVEVLGPIRIDNTSINGTGANGIFLGACNGQVEIGDPAAPVAGQVNISAAGQNGLFLDQCTGAIQITGGTIQTSNLFGALLTLVDTAVFVDATVLGRNGTPMMTIASNPGQAAIRLNTSTVRFENSIVTGGTGSPGADASGPNDGGEGGDGGAAIELRSDGNLLSVLSGSTITGGDAGNSGSASGTGSGGPLNPGGDGIHGDSDGDVITIEDSTVAGGRTGVAGTNAAGNAVFSPDSVGGDGITLDQGTTLSITDSTVSGGDARNNGLVAGTGLFVVNGFDSGNLDSARIYDITIDNSTVQGGNGIDGTALLDGTGGGSGIQIFESMCTLRIQNNSMVLGRDSGRDFNEDGLGANGGGAGVGLFSLAGGQILVNDSTVRGGNGGGLGAGLAGSAGGGGAAFFLIETLDTPSVLVVTLTNATLTGGDAGDGGATPTGPGDTLNDGGAGIVAAFASLTVNTVGPTTISGGRGGDGNGVQRGTRGGIGVEGEFAGVFNLNAGSTVQAGAAGNSAGAFDGGQGAVGVLVFDGAVANLNSATINGGDGGNASGTGVGGAGGAGTSNVDPAASAPNGTVNDNGSTITSGTAGTP